MNIKKIFLFGLVLLVFCLVVYFLFSKNQILTTPKKVEPATVSSQSGTPNNLEKYYAVYSNPYVIHLRKSLNGYLDGSNYGMDAPDFVIRKSSTETTLDGLSSFSQDYYKSKFIVMYIDNSVVGGKFISIIFQDKPDKMFTAWVYKLGDGTYDFRSFGQDLRYDSEKMAELRKQYSEFLIDKENSL